MVLRLFIIKFDVFSHLSLDANSNLRNISLRMLRIDL